MADNTQLGVAAGGDTIRTLDKTGTGAPKTEVVALDLGGGNGRSEFIAGFPLPVTTDSPVDDDNIPLLSLSPSSMDALEILFRQTIAAVGSPYASLAAELSTKVTINNAYPFGDLRRYGIIPNSTGAAAANTVALTALFNPGITAGPTGRFYSVNTTGTDVYYFNDMVPVRDGIWIDAQDCTWSFGWAASPIIPAANETNLGCLTAIRDFRLENISIVVFGTTGSVTSTLCGVQLGIRSNGTPRWPIAIYDAALAVPMGNLHLKNVRIAHTCTGAQISSVQSIAMMGGLQNVSFENIVINGGGNLQQGISYEFGFATSTANGNDVSMSQSSHMNGFRMENIRAVNFDNVNGASAGIIMDVAYNVSLDGYYFSGVSNGFITQPGECGNLFPWQPGGVLGSDATGAKHNVQLKNIVGDTFSSAGLNLSGIWAATPGSGYHTNNWTTGATILQYQTVMPAPTAWQQSHVYVTGNRVTANGKLWNCTTGGTSLSSGTGPSGTGSHLTGNAFNDNGVIWDFYPWQLFQAQGAGTTLGSGQGPFIAYGTSAPLTFNDNGISWLLVSPQAFTDIMDVVMDGITLNGASGAYAVYCLLGRMHLRNFTITGCQRGIVINDECTEFDINGGTISGCQIYGIEADTGAGNDLFNPPRLKRGRITNVKIRGCSALSAGSYPAIQLQWCDGVTIEHCVFGHEIRDSYIDETTQWAGVSLSNAAFPCTNIRIRHCRFGGSVGGNAIYSNTAIGNWSGGNTVENCSFNTAGSGLALTPLTNPISAIPTTAIQGCWENILQGVSADNGDASVSLQPHGSYQTQLFATTLTANRTVTLLTTNVLPGDMFRIVRTGLGAFTLNVGGLITIPANTAARVEVTYSGSAWVLTNYDVLTGTAAGTAYAAGSFTIPTENFYIMSNRLQLIGAQRATLQGTASLRIT